MWAGAERRFADLRTFLAPPTYLDTFSERGLLGIAFHPDFPSPPLVYLYHTIRKVPATGSCATPRNRIVSVWANGDVVDPTSYAVLLDDIHTATGIHNGGWLGVGPTDRKLYAAVGDNGVSTAARDLGSLNGKVLRLNLDGSTLADNPFVAQPTARGPIWALGLRNPYRCRASPTGTLFCAAPAGENGEGPGPTSDIGALHERSRVVVPTASTSQVLVPRTRACGNTRIRYRPAGSKPLRGE